jgi:hypothetical protein
VNNVWYWHHGDIRGLIKLEPESNGQVNGRNATINNVCSIESHTDTEPSKNNQMLSSDLGELGSGIENVIIDQDFTYSSQYECVWSGLITKIAYQITVGGLWVPHFVIREEGIKEFWVPIIDYLGFSVSKEKYCLRCGKIWSETICITDEPINKSEKVEHLPINENISNSIESENKVKEFIQPLPLKPICQNCHHDLMNERKELILACPEIFDAENENSTSPMMQNSTEHTGGVKNENKDTEDTSCCLCTHSERCLADHVILIALFENSSQIQRNSSIITVTTPEQIGLVQRTWDSTRLVLIWPEYSIFTKKNAIDAVIQLFLNKDSPFDLQLPGEPNDWKLRLFFGEGIRFETRNFDFCKENLKDVKFGFGDQLGAKLYEYLNTESLFQKSWNVAIGSVGTRDQDRSQDNRNATDVGTNLDWGIECSNAPVNFDPDHITSPGWFIEGYSFKTHGMWLNLAEGHITPWDHNPWNRNIPMNNLKDQNRSVFPDPNKNNQKSSSTFTNWIGEGWLNLEQFIGRWILI